MNPNDYQVGGSHYNAVDPGLQHWDLVALNNMNYYTGQLTKYVARWRNKNGVQDVQKAIHYCEKLIQVHALGLIPYPTKFQKTVKLQEFVAARQLTKIEVNIFRYAIMYRTADDLEEMLDQLRELLREAEHWQSQKSPTK